MLQAEPNEAINIAISDVPQLQARLSGAEDERKKTQDQLIAARLDLAQQSATVHGFEKIYPQLVGVSFTTPMTNSVPEETLQMYRDARVKEHAATELKHGLTTRLDQLDGEVKNAATTLYTTFANPGVLENLQWRLADRPMMK